LQKKENVMSHPLDNVVWSALNGKQKRFALGEQRAVRYPSAIAPFAAVADYSSDALSELRPLADTEGPLALVTTSEVECPSGFSVLRRGALFQMVWQGAPEPQSDLPHVALGNDDVPEMLALTTATQPGPFGPRTIELGSYIGVRDEGKLLAMAGERMAVDGFTEISAVCVDPSARGRGYAGGLMKLLMSAIAARGETPFLHVFTSNQGAIALYHALGFIERRELHLLVLGLEQ
jgi:ribosomal protein S18 acetylase RimI-like enzyme